MRTLPLYFLSLAAFIILFSGGLDITGLKYLVFLQNFFWAPPAFDYFSVSWSLAVEEWFYVLFPAFGRRRRLLFDVGCRRGISAEPQKECDHCRDEWCSAQAVMNPTRAAHCVSQCAHEDRGFWWSGGHGESGGRGPGAH